eukprot:TRINITY_DN6293_c0_g1_i1.p1 TRINITY_DN6293_c0_g1~~TRINITY_DN6293_c0_g1_i1.p1  ORF type:complete len:123 (-),score=5.88 TRINITY_DN6293_c0_g1_i1:62-430(-)
MWQRAEVLLERGADANHASVGSGFSPLLFSSACGGGGGALKNGATTIGSRRRCKPKKSHWRDASGGCYERRLRGLDGVTLKSPESRGGYQVAANAKEAVAFIGCAFIFLLLGYVDFFSCSMP